MPPRSVPKHPTFRYMKADSVLSLCTSCHLQAKCVPKHPIFLYMNAYSLLSLFFTCYMETKSVPKQTKIRNIVNCACQIIVSWLSCNAEDGSREGACI